VSTETATSTEAASFVERFAAAWADPSPEALSVLLHPEGRLIQPLEPEIRGRAAVEASWRRNFALIPDLRGEVLRWAASDDLLVIEVQLSGTIGGRRVVWISSDHIRLEDGLVKERVAHFDPTPLVGALLRSPPTLLRFARARLARR
jgi:hypothetical protein